MSGLCEFKLMNDIDGTVAVVAVVSFSSLRPGFHQVQQQKQFPHSIVQVPDQPIQLIFNVSCDASSVASGSPAQVSSGAIYWVSCHVALLLVLSMCFQAPIWFFIEFTPSFSTATPTESWRGIHKDQSSQECSRVGQLGSQHS